MGGQFITINYGQGHWLFHSTSQTLLLTTETLYMEFVS